MGIRSRSVAIRAVAGARKLKINLNLFTILPFWESNLIRVRSRHQRRLYKLASDRQGSRSFWPSISSVLSCHSRLHILPFSSHFHTISCPTSPHLHLGLGHHHIILHTTIAVTGEGAGSREREGELRAGSVNLILVSIWK